MKNKDKISVMLLALILVLGVLLLLTFIPEIHTNISGTAPSVNQNSLKLNTFLAKNGYKNESTFKDLILLNGSNELVFGCNQVILPAFPTSSLANNTDVELMGYYITQNAICEINNESYNCSAVKSSLYNLTYPIINKTLVPAFFQEIKNETLQLYDEMLNATQNKNTSIPSYISAPINYDVKIINQTENSTSAMLLTLINLKQVPSIININNTLPTEGYSTNFQTPAFYFPGIKSCGNNVVFNLIMNENETLSAEYRDLLSMKSINITNICIQSSGNTCNETEMNETKSTFYVPT